MPGPRAALLVYSPSGDSLQAVLTRFRSCLKLEDPYVLLSLNDIAGYCLEDLHVHVYRKQKQKQTQTQTYIRIAHVITVSVNKCVVEIQWMCERKSGSYSSS